MKPFDIIELKKTARIKEMQNNRSYSQIHKSPLRASVQQTQNDVFVLSRWGKSFQKSDDPTPWSNIGQGVINVAVGEQHSLILNNKNQCYSYGRNSYGQLAQQSQSVTKISQIVYFKDMKIIAIYCGTYHSFVQNSKGQLYAFGLNLKGQLGLGNNQNRKKPILVHTLLPGGSKNPKSNFFIDTMSESKKKHRKSREQLSQLNNIMNLINKFEPQEETKSPVFHLNSDQHVTKVACGPLHTAVLTNKQRLFTCGYGEKFALGNGRNKSICDFSEVKIKNNGKVDKLEAGNKSLGYISGGRIYLAGTFGDKVFQTFTPINSSEEFIDLKLCEKTAIFLSRKGDVYQFGEIYKDNDEKYFSEGARKIEKLKEIKTIFNGCNQFFAFSEHKLLYGWGENEANQVTGVSDNNFIHVPKMLKIPINFNQNFNIVCGSKTSFLLSSQKLDTSISIERDKPENAYHQIENFTPPQKLTRIKSSVQKSNICGTEEKQMLNELGLHPRMFNCNIEIDFDQLTFESQISEGGYGIIYKGLWRETVVAIKMFKVQSENAVKDFFSECGAMEALRHPNIVMFLGACTKAPNFAIVLEYCSKGTLWSTIQNTDYDLPWETRKRFALDTARSINYLHTCNPPIIHRDLKSLNLLMDESCRVKLADFGWTKGLDNYMTGKIGTYQWMAPEVIGGQKYSQKADVFSFGIILWEIASRQPPFRHLSGIEVSLQVLNNDLRPTIPKKTPQAFVKLMKKCWDRDPKKRPSFKDIIKDLQNLKFDK